jgi:hypothetical protein
MQKDIRAVEIYFGVETRLHKEATILPNLQTFDEKSRN